MRTQRSNRLLEKGLSNNMSSPEMFDFSLAMHRLCRDIAFRMEEFSHLRMDEVAVTYAQARRRVAHGLQAKLTPMRFEEGRLTTCRGGRHWTVQRLFTGEGQEKREILYILTFYLPRFLDHSFREKMVTIFHELYHVSPLFDGDLRRMGGRYHVHTCSQKQYDQQMEVFADRYLSLAPPQPVYEFLKQNFRQLQRQHGQVVGMRVPIPKLIPLSDSKSA